MCKIIGTSKKPFETSFAGSAGRTSWRTREQAENALFTYIDGSYNREHIQARLGWLSPDEYEHTWHTSRAHFKPPRPGRTHSELPGEPQGL